jgi:hypothetical protein
VALAQMVDRRVGDLGEALAEVRGGGARAAGERRQRGVVAHGRGRLMRLGGSGPEQQRQVLARVPGRHVPPGQALGRRFGRHAGSE